ncbi:chemotaxis phosphatase [Candidatus Photodesmus blepharus]|uniref:Protein phosphatase CheZ n=1 Tax=Candidatus Photodesmus blepharonis TaxID=1179155 RepID=A0A084CMW6_9GAMM|nr:protein phosphatase CheZ [Candidatus Photodesmus blepharus]KEY91145.1 chemotaxis phosphatase [Candidatus Photodesmus blepharus]
MISLEQAKQLIKLLEQGQQEEADILVKVIYEGSENAMLQEIGILTRDLHDSLKEFNLDEITNNEIPNAKERLQYVIDKTRLAANKTMDAVDECMLIVENFHSVLLEVRPQWNELMSGRIKLAEFKSLCHKIDELLSKAERNNPGLKKQLTQILTAQDFQDLTGQMIQGVITLVSEVEFRLVQILTVFGENQNKEKKNNQKVSLEPSGPVLNAKKKEDDVVSSQDEVDDLLASLGF